MKKISLMLIMALLCLHFTAMGQPKPPQPPKNDAKPAAKADTLPPKQAKWKSAPIPGWYIHYDEAVKAAKKANKKIFVLNAGSDWDGASVSLRKSVLDTRDFQQIAKRSLVLLYLDTPQKFPQPEEQIRHHDIIRERLQLKGKKIPYAVIIDTDGKIITQIEGVLPKKDYLDIIQKAVVGTLGHK
ncbi:MAG: thioredoxin family protein [Victivallales bacterium]|nr:thioredoxin family protein [Victivallales bacterium]